MRRLLQLVLFVLPLRAATLTVCASGCDYTTLQAALNAASRGDIIEMTAGETFTECVKIPYLAGTDYITVRSSAYASLPADGNRVNPTDHAALMPVLRPSSATCEAIRAGQYERRIAQNGVNTSTDYITYSYTVDGALTEGTPITFGAGHIRTLPSPLQRLTTYYARNPSGYTCQVSATVDGAIIDLTDQGSASESYYYSRPWIATVNTPAYWKFIGLDIQTKSGTVASYPLVQIGGDETTVESTPDHIEFYHSMVRGQQDEDGPKLGVLLNGADLIFQDGYVDHIKKFSEESHGFTMTNTPGPVLIKNNFVAAASMGFLTGGSGAAIDEQNVTDVTIQGNHFVKRGYMFYNAGSSVPSGACYYGNGSGRFFRHTTPNPNTCANGACYVCQPDGTWAQDTGAVYRNDDYLLKSGVEFKSCDGCLMEGNVVEGTHAAQDTGNTTCILVSQVYNGVYYNVIKDTTIQNNWCKNTWSGLYVGTDGAAYDEQVNNVTIQNNLVTGYSNFPAQSMYGTYDYAQQRPIALAQGMANIVIAHNTVRAAPSQTHDSWVAMMLGYNTGTPTVCADCYIRDNIVPNGYYAIFADGSDGTCGTGGWGKWWGTASSPKYVANNVLYHTSSGNPTYYNCNPTQNLVRRIEAEVQFVGTDTEALTDPTKSALASTSPYSHSCAASCAFDATDDTDVGVDIAALVTAIEGAISGEWESEPEPPPQPGTASGSRSMSGAVSIR